MKTYPICEHFYSIQGEGLHLGRAAYFLRFWGCNVKCQWCDTKNSWSGVPTEMMTCDNIVDSILESGTDVVVITGGEPCLHNLEPLLVRLNSLRMEVNLETSGTLEIKEIPEASFDWVALSPKLFHQPRQDALERADELKIIVSEASELEKYQEYVQKATNAKAVWIHPEWSHHNDTNLLAAIVDFVKLKKGVYRAGWQIHKNYFVR